MRIKLVFRIWMLYALRGPTRRSAPTGTVGSHTHAAGWDVRTRWMCMGILEGILLQEALRSSGGSPRSGEPPEERDDSWLPDSTQLHWGLIPEWVPIKV